MDLTTYAIRTIFLTVFISIYCKLSNQVSNKRSLQWFNTSSPNSIYRITIPSQAQLFMVESSGPLFYKVQAKAFPPTKLIFKKIESKGTNGNWTISRDTGQIIYNPPKDYYGVDVLSFTVTGKWTNPPRATVQSGSIRVSVRSSPDPPHILVAFGDMGVMEDPGSPIQIFVEEYNVGRKTEIELYFGSYDLDLDDDLEMKFSQFPQNGGVILQNLKKEHKTSTFSCNPHKQLTFNKSYPDLTSIIPCRIKSEHTSQRISWISNSVIYTPNWGFHGNDSFRVVSHDSFGLPSIAVTVIVWVLMNPCRNRATCQGIRNNDPHCKSNIRSRGFFELGYICKCVSGWSGTVCEININDCSSSPCDHPEICVDQVNGYKCKCPPHYASCRKNVPGWQMALITAAVGFFVVIITGLLIFCAKRRMDTRGPRRGSN